MGAVTRDELEIARRSNAGAVNLKFLSVVVADRHGNFKFKTALES
jgi:hypothetical protein